MMHANIMLYLFYLHFVRIHSNILFLCIPSLKELNKISELLYFDIKNIYKKSCGKKAYLVNGYSLIFLGSRKV